jgi:hypothetical protein
MGFVVEDIGNINDLRGVFKNQVSWAQNEERSPSSLSFCVSTWSP